MTLHDHFRRAALSALWQAPYSPASITLLRIAAEIRMLSPIIAGPAPEEVVRSVMGRHIRQLETMQRVCGVAFLNEQIGMLKGLLVMGDKQEAASDAKTERTIPVMVRVMAGAE